MALSPATVLLGGVDGAGGSSSVCFRLRHLRGGGDCAVGSRLSFISVSLTIFILVLDQSSSSPHPSWPKSRSSGNTSLSFISASLTTGGSGRVAFPGRKSF